MGLSETTTVDIKLAFEVGRAASVAVPRLMYHPQ